MKSIVYKDLSCDLMFIYQPKYPAQRSIFEEKKNERIQNAMAELKPMGNIALYLLQGNKLRLIAIHR